MKVIGFVLLAASLFAQTDTEKHSSVHNANGQVMHTHHPTGDADGVSGTITGYVRDVACLLRNLKAGAATIALTQDCMRKCVQAGSPIGILTEEGMLYTPVSNQIPDTAMRSRMLPYVGKYVRAKGQLFERGGLHAISIQSIEMVDRPADSKIPAL